MKALVRMVCESEEEWGLLPPHPKTTSAECNHCAAEVYLEVDKKAFEALEFCVARLIHVYGESPNVDFILNASAALESIRDKA